MKKIITILMITILILLFDNVKAESFTSVWVPGSTWKESGSNTWSNTYNRGDSFHTFSSSISNGAKSYYMKFDSQDSITGYNELEITIKFIPLKQDSITYDPNISTSCTTQYSTNSSGYSTITSFNCTGTQSGTGYINKVNWGLTLSYFFNGNVDLKAPCFVKSNIGTNYTFTCPITTNNIDGFVIEASTNTINLQFESGFYYLYTLRKDGSQSIIDNQNQNTQEIINSNTSYEGINQSEEINGSQELTSYEQEEQNLLDSLNMTEIDNLDITINPNASSFIWTIVDALKNMSSKIIVFMTSVLGLGVIKMLLNR